MKFTPEEKPNIHQFEAKPDDNGGGGNETILTPEQEELKQQKEKIQGNLDLLDSFYKDAYRRDDTSEHSIQYLSDIVSSSGEELRPHILNKIKEILKQEVSKSNSSENRQRLALHFFFCREPFFRFGSKEDVDFVLNDLAEWVKDKGYDKVAEACQLYIQGDSLGAIKLFEEHNEDDYKNGSDKKYYGSAEIAAQLSEREGNTEEAKRMYSKYADKLATIPDHKGTDSRYLEALVKADRKEEALKILSDEDRFIKSPFANWEVDQVIDFAQK